MEYLERKAYAKINVNLNVLGKRPDGYHELESFMQAIDLSDRVRVGWEPCPSGLPAYAVPSVEYPEELAADVRTSTPALSGGPDNLAYKAAVLMHERYHSGLRERIAIDIEKNIPIAAGLAGGSADAAAVLAALADLWRLSDSERADLPGLAATLGADVPFCLAVQTGINACIATGRGDVLRAVTPLSCKVLLSTPDFPVSTAAVYAALKKEDCDTVFDTEALAAAAAAATDFDEAVRHAGNHLQAAALRLYPEIQNTLEWVGKQGNPAAVLVSGSGPSVFGLYPHGSPMEGKCVCHGPNLNTYFVATLS